MTRRAPSAALGLAGSFLLLACGTYDGVNVAKQQPGWTPWRPALGAVTASEQAPQKEQVTPPPHSDAQAHGNSPRGVAPAPEEASKQLDEPAEPGSPLAQLATAPTTVARGGERLRARTLVTDDGQRGWQGWYDSELEQNCEFERDAQGILRCLPTTAARQIYFLDETCTQGIAQVDLPCGQADSVEYAYAQGTTACGSGFQIYTLGDAVPAPNSAFQLSAAGACEPAAPLAGSYRRLAGPVAPQRFVAAEYAVSDEPSRIKSYGILAEDGAFHPTGFVDAELDLSCAWSGDSEVSCVPRAQQLAYFSDERQAYPLIAEFAADCSSATPSAGVRVNPITCLSAFYRSAERFQGAQVYTRWGSQIDNAPEESGGLLFYTLSDRILPDQFAVGTLQKVSRGTRLSPVYWYADDGGFWFSHWYDGVLGAACSFLPTGNGEAVCMPRGTSASVLFTDAQCQQAVTQVLPAGACQADAVPPSWVNDIEHNQCGNNLRATRRVLGEVIPTSLYGRDASGACVAHDLDDKSRYYRLSAPILPEQLVHASDSVE